MESWHRNRLSAGQAEFVETRLPGVRFLNDLSWNLVDTAVLEVAHGQGRYVIKAAGPSNRHIRRELDAHEAWTEAWARQERAPILVHANPSLNLLITEYLEGYLVEGSAAEYESGTYLQAGQLLREFQAQTVRTDSRYEAAATEKAMAWLETPHRIEESVAGKVRGVLAAYRPEPVPVVPTHGDWQPRNWLMNGAELRVIDFGRFEFRPAISDFCRLAVQQWRTRPELEAAFFEGYGSDPRGSRLWNITLLREAVTTAAWAFQVGDREFEKQGHRMLADALANYRTGSSPMLPAQPGNFG
ncbi:phosphotransferase [Arthrobacter sp. OV608]|uniref:phosphotransferase n=1 Tax=Arthrobacter sp. OV608 TaxID=1882768 RepID=UPI0008ADC171|nr:phosphotransferase [Arthrobacter sp. OV608]SER30528.1 Phosphotransferase enzyme family protein [Arthrobacter sp. OV608]